jgi:hypothetical protein
MGNTMLVVCPIAEVAYGLGKLALGSRPAPVSLAVANYPRRVATHEGWKSLDSPE